MRSLKSSLLAVACLTIGFVAHAQAGVVTYTGYTVLADQDVTIQFKPHGQLVTERGGAGQITLTGTNTQGGSLVTWCIDLAHNLLGAGQFDIAEPVVNDFGNAFNSLVSHFDPTSYNASAAMQVAIWRLEYGSNATITPDNADVSKLADSYLADLQNGTWKPDQNKQFVRLSGVDANQDQGILVPVPEPASMAILGVGLFAIGMIRPKRA